MINNFKGEDNQLKSIESHEFMDDPHRLFEKQKESKGHLESEDVIHYDFDMEHSEYIGNFNHIHPPQIESSIDNKFDFNEAHENEPLIHPYSFMHDEFRNNPQQFD